MWKTWTNQGCEGNSAFLSACSACAGEYEDPDRTAPVDERAEETEEIEGWGEGTAGAEGFLNGERMPQG